jgi:tRNA(adenine34) deaminase
MNFDVDVDRHWMRIALDEARLGFEMGEVPVGAVSVISGNELSRDHNRIEVLNDASAHAEMQVLRNSAQLLNRWRLTDVTLYVTVEPCPMCAMALVLFRVARVVFGAREPKTGGYASFAGILGNTNLNHIPLVAEGVLADESSGLLKEFFRSRRMKD